MKIRKDYGLTNQQVLASRAKFGENILPTKGRYSTLRIFISQFQSPLVIILFFAAFITLVLELNSGKTLIQIPEFFAIIGVVFINSILGFIQEFQAQDTLKKLKETLKQEITVLRNGREIEVNIHELVVGDLIKFKLGDKIPADGLIIEGSNIQVNESALTGESRAISKNFVQVGNQFTIKDLEIKDEKQLLMGTSIVSGIGSYVITQIGVNTQFGKIAQKVSESKEEETPLQKKLKQLSIYLAIFALSASFILFTLGVLIGEDLKEFFEVSVSLAVSSVPEALVISLTVILTVGMTRLLRQKALVRKLIVAETLGSVTTICIDKTGTITHGIMEVEDTKTTNKNLFLKALLFNNNDVNSVDQAINDWIKNKAVREDKLEKKLDTLTFASKNKFSATLTNKYFYVIGAPEILLKKSKMNKKEQDFWENIIEEKSNKGLRIIGVAYKHSSGSKINKSMVNDLIWLGIVSINDPVRRDVGKVITSAIKSGVDVKIITGDYKNTALYVLKELKIEVSTNEIISGDELEKLNEKDLKKKIKDVKLFYRTSPDQKFRIVTALKALGESVAMMGDGINDAPALKAANVGIVVNNATEVSKETADIVLLDSNFKTIISAIEEGRSIFQNIRKLITYLLSGSFDEILLVGGSIILGLPLALTPLQILYINVIVDGLPDIALAFEPKEKDILSKKKVASKNLFNNEMLAIIFGVGAALSAIMLFSYFYFYKTYQNEELARSLLFAMLTLNSLIYVFAIKSLNENIWNYNFLNNTTLNLSVLGGIIFLIFSFTFEPLTKLLELTRLNFDQILFIIVIAFLNLFIVEIIKLLFISKMSKE